jgi:hypothetical protein
MILLSVLLATSMNVHHGQRLKLSTLSSPVTIFNTGPVPPSTMNAKFVVYGSNRELFFVDVDDKYHINPDVTSEDIARAFIKQILEMNKERARDRQQFLQDINRVLRILQGPPKTPDRL